MSVFWICLIVLGLAAAGFVLGRNRAIARAGGDARKLHSRPVYYGWSVALYTALPALLVLLVWLFVQPVIVSRVVGAAIPDDAIPEGQTRALVLSETGNIAGTLSAAINRRELTRAAVRSLTPADTAAFDKLKAAQLPVLTRPAVLEAAKHYLSLARSGLADLQRPDDRWLHRAIRTISAQIRPRGGGVAAPGPQQSSAVEHRLMDRSERWRRCTRCWW